MRSTLQSVSHFFSHGKKKRKEWGFPEELCRRFSLAETWAATDQRHRERLHNGVGLGSVYKGHIKVDREEDRTEVVAIKYISERQMHEFRGEVQLLCQLRHPNLISPVGFCQENGVHIIVYEYMPNGILSDHLFDTFDIKNKDVFPLTWKQRLKICIGVARAVHYLHAGVKHVIVHHSVRCSTILLDQNLEPKLSGIGIAKMGPLALSNALIRLDTGNVIGKARYLDPEYLLSGQLTDKSDVFSFGIVLFEVLCAKSCSRPRIKCVEGGKNFLDMIDPFLKGKVATDCLRKFMKIAERCVCHTVVSEFPKGLVLYGGEHVHIRAHHPLSVNRCGMLQNYTYPAISFSEITHTLFYSGSGRIIEG